MLPKLMEGAQEGGKMGVTVSASECAYIYCKMRKKWEDMEWLHMENAANGPIKWLMRTNGDKTVTVTLLSR